MGVFLANRLKKEIIKLYLVLYVSIPLPELIEKAREKRIWLLKATEEFVPLKEIV